MKSQFGTLPLVGALWLTFASCSESHVGTETDGGPPVDSGTTPDGGTALDGGTHGDGGTGLDGGRGDATIDAQVDSSKPVGSCQDAASPLCGDASATCLPIDQSYKFYFDGGLSPNTYTSEVLPDGSYQRVRRMGTSITTCNSQLSCGSTASDAGIDQAELAAALANADVVAAFAAANSDLSSIYGSDSRPVDGQVFVIKRGSDKQFAVGGPCNGTTGCREIPAGVSQLVTLLQRLDQEQHQSGPCAGF